MLPRIGGVWEGSGMVLGESRGGLGVFRTLVMKVMTVREVGYVCPPVPSLAQGTPGGFGHPQMFLGLSGGSGGPSMCCSQQELGEHGGESHRVLRVPLSPPALRGSGSAQLVFGVPRGTLVSLSAASPAGLW